MVTVVTVVTVVVKEEKGRRADNTRAVITRSSAALWRNLDGICRIVNNVGYPMPNTKNTFCELLDSVHHKSHS